MKKSSKIKAVVIFFLTLSLFGNYNVFADPACSAKVTAKDTSYVIVCGIPVGIRLKSQGVIVTGFLGFTMSDDSFVSPAKQAGVSEGDRITEIDGECINSIEEMQRKLNSLNTDTVKLTLENSKGRFYKSVKLKRDSETNQLRLGIWAKDNVAGIGTLTFYSETYKVYGALGHAISDNGKRYEISGGFLKLAEITGIKKGAVGTPGELRGYFRDRDENLGCVYANYDTGIYGLIDDTVLKSLSNGFQRFAVAKNSEIHKGNAYIFSSAIEGKPCKYEIEITQINKAASDGTKSFNIKIKDSRLIEATGGIVQGMSGSPIIQDGKFAGAVTHVMINDPTCGYGIFAENMLKSAMDAIKPQPRANVLDELSDICAA